MGAGVAGGHCMGLIGERAQQAAASLELEMVSQC